jgi:hypothetical protein
MAGASAVQLSQGMPFISTRAKAGNLLSFFLLWHALPLSAANLAVVAFALSQLETFGM